MNILIIVVVVVAVVWLSLLWLRLLLLICRLLSKSPMNLMAGGQASVVDLSIGYSLSRWTLRLIILITEATVPRSIGIAQHLHEQTTTSWLTGDRSVKEKAATPWPPVEKNTVNSAHKLIHRSQLLKLVHIFIWVKQCINIIANISANIFIFGALSSVTITNCYSIMTKFLCVNNSDDHIKY